MFVFSPLACAIASSEGSSEFLKSGIGHVLLFPFQFASFGGHLSHSFLSFSHNLATVFFCGSDRLSCSPFSKTKSRYTRLLWLKYRSRVYLLFVFEKGEQDNLSEPQKKTVAKLCEKLRKECERWPPKLAN